MRRKDNTKQDIGNSVRQAGDDSERQERQDSEGKKIKGHFEAGQAGKQQVGERIARVRRDKGQQGAGETRQCQTRDKTVSDRRERTARGIRDRTGKGSREDSQKQVRQDSEMQERGHQEAKETGQWKTERERGREFSKRKKRKHS
ncbi:hypothetical protein PoB_003403600 [Plakobranchus ocellatus]|uniref:Uncharacterized protein n=1 Tax=Plakobranchus ocellatus TaxID=259542 RepID=A0AAV4ALS6_9GAST|nr:hypothetical protein PoB_003403600 [Plakobranchus ocellatus]